MASTTSSWTITNALRSERLSYRALENVAEDVDFLHALMLDPYCQAFAGRHMLRPLSRKKTEGLVPKMHAGNFITAIIMLEPTTAPPRPAPGAPGGSLEAQPPTAESIGLLVVGGDLVPEHMHLRDSEIGILLKDGYRGQGYGTEAINWATDWAFRHADMRRVSISCYGQNEGAQRLYKRLGFVEEGRRRKKAYYNMKWYDEVLLGILREEWLALRGLTNDGEPSS